MYCVCGMHLHTIAMYTVVVDLGGGGGENREGEGADT